MYNRKIFAHFFLSLILTMSLATSCKKSSSGTKSNDEENNDDKTTTETPTTTNPLNLIVSITGHSGTSIELAQYTQQALTFDIQGNSLNVSNLVIVLNKAPQASSLANNTTLTPTFQWFSGASGSTSTLQLLVRDRKKCLEANATTCDIPNTSGVANASITPNYNYDSTFSYTLQIVAQGDNTDPDNPGIFDWDYWNNIWKDWVNNDDPSYEETEKGFWDYMKDFGYWLWDIPGNISDWFKNIFSF